MLIRAKDSKNEQPVWSWDKKKLEWRWLFWTTAGQLVPTDVLARSSGVQDPRHNRGLHHLIKTTLVTRKNEHKCKSILVTLIQTKIQDLCCTAHGSRPPIILWWNFISFLLHPASFGERVSWAQVNNYDFWFWDITICNHSCLTSLLASLLTSLLTSLLASHSLSRRLDEEQAAGFGTRVHFADLIREQGLPIHKSNEHIQTERIERPTTTPSFFIGFCGGLNMQKSSTCQSTWVICTMDRVLPAETIDTRFAH